MAVAAATIVAKNQLALGRVLARSFRRHHPEIPFFLLLADEVDGCFDPAVEPFHLIELAELAIPDRGRFLMRYPQQPLSYACTPFLLGHLLRSGWDRVLFLKQESLVLARMDDAIARLDQCSVLLTPHLVAPLRGADAAERELTILLSGAANIGFVGVSDTAAAHALLSWWAERTQAHCLHAVGDGMHYEQRWLDLAPSYFEGVGFLRDPAYNVAHWNLPERRVETAGGRVLVGGRPCRLFRFSGFDPEHPDRPTRYFERPRMDEIGGAAHVFARYLELLEEAGLRSVREWPYAWGRFDNGVEVPEIVREIFRDLEAAGVLFERPFATDPAAGFYRWLTAPAMGAAAVTNLWLGVWKRRPDVRLAYPEPGGRDRDGFAAWTRSSGAHEHAIPEVLWGSDD
jgi:hypothetical protein